MMRYLHRSVAGWASCGIMLSCFATCWGQSTVVSLDNIQSTSVKGRSDLVSNDIPPQVRSVEQSLEQIIPANLLGRLTVRQIMNELRELGMSVVLDESARENNVDEQTPLQMTLGGQSIGTNLVYALEPFYIEYQIDHRGVVVIRSVDSMLDNLTEIIYDVSSFTASPEEMAEVIMETIDPDTWEDYGGTARMKFYYTGGRRMLVITNTYYNQRKIRRHLDSLARMSGAAGAVASLDDGGIWLSGSTVIAMPGDRQLTRRRGGAPGGFGGGFGGRGGSGLGGGVF